MFRPLHNFALLATVVASVCLPSDAEAQDARARADKALKDGATLFTLQDYPGALERFREAASLHPGAKVELHMGRTLDAMGREAGAATYYARFMARQGPEVEGDGTAPIRERLAELRRRLARVRVEGPAPGAAVEVDKKAVGSLPLPGALFLAPGKHRVRVSADGRVLVDRALTLAAGGQVTVTVPRPVAVQPRQLDTPLVPRARPIYKRWWFWTIVGVAVTGAVVGGVAASQTGGSEWLPSGDSGRVRLY